MGIEKAVKCIRMNGNEVEQARLNYVLSNERPSEEIKAKLFADQLIQCVQQEFHQNTLYWRKPPHSWNKTKRMMDIGRVRMGQIKTFIQR